MDKTQALEKLQSVGQQHLLQYFDLLTPVEQHALLGQIESFNIPMFRMQQQMLVAQQYTPTSKIEPFQDVSIRGNEKDKETGQRLISEGKIGCIVIAGGQGTRLKVNGPKGMVPVSLIKNKSLFQLFAEKTFAAGKLANRKLAIAVMTSPQNHAMTLAFFKANEYFKLDPDQITFFSQGLLPLLDMQGNLFLDVKGHIAEGPNGNGSSLTHFSESGIWKAWYENGVRYVNYVLIDNALADPFDAELVGHQYNETSDVAIKCTDRRDAHEKVGVLAKQGYKVKVIEYSELPENEKSATNQDGALKHRCANISLFSFSMDFIKKVSNVEMPLHLAHKAVRMLNEEGNTIQPEEPNAWKFEKFIFDVLPHALNATALLYPREECFAPLKNFAGDASIEEVQKALLNHDRSILQKLTEKIPPDFPIELAQDFYYPSEDLLKKWKGQSIEKPGYIVP